MKNAIAASILRVKVQCYALLFRLQHLLIRVARVLPGCWPLLGIPRREIPEVETWVAETSGARSTFGAGRTPAYVTFGSPGLVLRRSAAPPGVDGVHPELRQQHLEFRPPFLARVPSARVLGPEGSVITPDGGILAESTWSRGLFQQDRIYRSLRFPRPQLLSGSYYTIASPFSHNYYHWIVEILTRLFAYESVASDRPRLIVNSFVAKWQLESLELLGFQKDDLLTLDHQYLQLENLYVPSLIGINPYTLAWLKTTLAKSIPAESPSKRVYITRRHAARRRLLNENEVEAMLQQHGFIIFELGTLSFAQQVLLFREAEMIVSIHGAGLTNMVYAAEGCKVMEIVDPMHVGVMYYMLAETLRHRYWPCAGQSAGDESAGHGGAHGHGDITVPLDLFKNTLAEMLGGEA
jgi:hypothetical protein